MFVTGLHIDCFVCTLGSVYRRLQFCRKTYDYAPLPKGSDLKLKTHRGVIKLSNVFMDGKTGLYLFK